MWRPPLPPVFILQRISPPPPAPPPRFSQVARMENKSWNPASASVHADEFYPYRFFIVDGNSENKVSSGMVLCDYV